MKQTCSVIYSERSLYYITHTGSKKISTFLQFNRHIFVYFIYFLALTRQANSFSQSMGPKTMMPAAAIAVAQLIQIILGRFPGLPVSCKVLPPE